YGLWKLIRVDRFEDAAVAVVPEDRSDLVMEVAQTPIDHRLLGVVGSARVSAAAETSACYLVGHDKVDHCIGREEGFCASGLRHRARITVEDVAAERHGVGERIAYAG